MAIDGRACGRLGFDPEALDPTRSEAYAQVVDADLPVAYWRFEDTSEGVAVDEISARSVSISGERSPAVGVAGSRGLVFDGSTTRVVVGDEFAFTGSPYTLELWLEPAVLDDQVRFLISRVSDATPTVGYALFYAQSFTLASRTIASTEQGYAGGAGPRSSANHIVATYDGVETALYLDGVYQGGQAASPLPAQGVGTFVIGDVAPGQFYKTYGILDEIAIYDAALPPERIRAHFEAGR